MKIKLIVILFCGLFSSLFAQESTTDIGLSIGPVLSLDWSAYHWYQKPQSQAISANRSAGQVLNVMPGARLGLIFNFDVSYSSGRLNYYDDFYLLLEGGVNYYPFSFDMDEYKGQSSISFPLSLSTQIPLGNLHLNIGLGVQFSKIELNNIPFRYQKNPNYYFTTYFVELGLGETIIDYSVFLGYDFFARVGLGLDNAISLDIGVRGRIGLIGL